MEVAFEYQKIKANGRSRITQYLSRQGYSDAGVAEVNPVDNLAGPSALLSTYDDAQEAPVANKNGRDFDLSCFSDWLFSPSNNPEAVYDDLNAMNEMPELMDLDLPCPEVEDELETAALVYVLGHGKNY